MTDATKFDLFLDLDGVFADLEAHFFKLTGTYTYQVPSRKLWQLVARTPHFFLDLPLCEGADVLWEAVKGLKPTMLTGSPSMQVSRDEKVLWVQTKKHVTSDGREFTFDPVPPVIVCARKDKIHHAHPRAVLVDDRVDNVTAWQAAGGLGVLHSSVSDSLTQLRDLGLVD